MSALDSMWTAPSDLDYYGADEPEPEDLMVRCTECGCSAADVEALAVYHDLEQPAICCEVR